MKQYNIKLQLVTPCISAGADQAQAEFRAPSIRGQLRNWFRILGHSLDEERKLFGGIGVKDEREGKPPLASKIIVRILTDMSKLYRDHGNAAKIKPNSVKGPDYILWPFAQTKDTNPDRGFLLANQEIEFQVIYKGDTLRDNVSQEISDLESALKAFLLLGAIGSRSRRAYGSIFPTSVQDGNSSCDWVPHTKQDLKNMLSRILPKSVSVITLWNTAYQDYPKAIQTCADFLKNAHSVGKEWPPFSPTRQKDFVAPLGLPLPGHNLSRGDKNSRWGSPVLFKIVKLNDGYYPLAIFLKDYFLKEDTPMPNGQFSSNDLLDALSKPERHNEFGWSGAEKLY